MRSVTSPALGRHRTAPAPARPAALGPPSRDVTPDNDGEDGTHDEAGSDSEIREAGPREATSSPPRFSQNRVELREEENKMLQGRLTTARLEKAAVHLTVSSDPRGSLSRF